MDTRQDTNRRSDVIRCEFCGEDYSTTYRHCPFCDNAADQPVSRSAGPRSAAPRVGSRRPRGRKRRRKSRGGLAIEPVRIIGYALGLILIIAAIYIVCTMLAPLFGGDTPASTSSSAPASSVHSSAGVSASTSSMPEVSTSTPAPGVSTSQPDVSVSTPQVITPAIKTTAITLNKTDFTLAADEVHKLVATLTPADSEEAVVWTCSDPAVAHVAPDGTITNINTANSTKAVTVTATSGSVSAQCIVRCRPGSTGTVPSTPGTPTTPSTPQTPGTPETPTTPETPSTPVAAGTKGTITSAGVRIRSGPGSNYDPLASATKGAKVTVLEKTGDGWYKIEFIGDGGNKIGYISADYVKID